MKTITRWQLTLALTLMAGVALPGQSAAAGTSAGNPSFTIRVRNDAGVDSKTLKEAEDVASKIFERAGVVSQWAEAPRTSQEAHEPSIYERSGDQHSGDQQLGGLSQIRVNILPATMSNRMNVPAGVTGLAPGSGPGRLLAYVFYERVEGLAQREAQRQAAAQAQGSAARRASEAQILGVVMAHEIGHILLNLAVHTKTGIMRGQWDLDGLRDIAEDYVSFTRQQAEVIQAEIARRARLQNVADATGRFETPVSLSR